MRKSVLRGGQLIRSVLCTWYEVTASKRRVWAGILGTLFSLGFLWLSLRGVDLAALAAFVATSKLWWIGLAAVANLVNLWFRAIRWQRLLQTAKILTVGDTFSATMIGFAINNILPARLGELFKVYVLADEHELRQMTVLATVAAERLFDMLILLLLLLISLFLGYSQQLAWMPSSTIYLVLLCLGMVGFLLIMWRKAEELVNWLKTQLGQRRHQKYERILNGLLTFAAGLEWMSREKSRTVWAILGYSGVIWLSMLANVFFVIKAFTLDLPASASLITLVTQSLGMLIPSGPAGIGTYEFMTIVSLRLFAVEQSKALAFSLVLHATRFLPTTIIGVIFLLQWFYRRSQRVNSAQTLPVATNFNRNEN